MKAVGGILGILGGLGGFGIGLLLVLGTNVDGTADVIGLTISVIGMVCGLACIGLGICVLMSRGRLAGALMILPALLGLFFTFGGTLLALPGGILAAFFGETKVPEESYDTRQSRLEKEVQQRYGARS